MYVLDTNILLYHLGGRLVGELPNGDRLVSVVTELELLSYPAITPEIEVQIRQLLASFEIVDLGPAVKDGAVRLRRAHSLKLPDAIIAATALAHDAQLVTNDARLGRTPGLRSTSLPLRPL